MLSPATLLIFALALWMGLYLLHRNGHKPAMRFTGIGLVAYAAGLVLLVTFDWVVGLLLLSIIPALCWIAAVITFWRNAQESRPPTALFWLVVVASIFLVVSFGSLLLPRDFLLSDYVQIAIGLDLLLLGYGIAALDAFDEGEAFLPHALRSLLAAAFAIVLLGGQVVMVMAIEGRSLAMDLLLVSMTAVSIVVTIFAGVVQQWLDDVTFGRGDARREQRAELRAVADALPRSNAALSLLQLDDTTFESYTRRALSHLGNLPRLTTNPLMQLPLLDDRLQDAADGDRTLIRAMALKRLLTERIDNLRPPNGTHGITDEWRFYNALYYPYVAGLKPYSTRLDMTQLSEQERIVMEWFRVQVPERTLYNWQKAAAKLIAQDLRSTMQHNGSIAAK